MGYNFNLSLSLCLSCPLSLSLSHAPFFFFLQFIILSTPTTPRLHVWGQRKDCVVSVSSIDIYRCLWVSSATPPLCLPTMPQWLHGWFVRAWCQQAAPHPLPAPALCVPRQATAPDACMTRQNVTPVNTHNHLFPFLSLILAISPLLLSPSSSLPYCPTFPQILLHLQYVFTMRCYSCLVLRRQGSGFSLGVMGSQWWAWSLC